MSLFIPLIHHLHGNIENNSVMLRLEIKYAMNKKK